MKNILKNSIVFTSILIGLISYSQSSSTIDFTLSSENYLVAGQNANLQSTIKKSGNTLIWTQFESDGTFETSTVQIEQIIGTWNTENSSGTLTYQITIGGFQSYFTLKGGANSLVVTLTIKISETQQQIYTFYNNLISYQ